MNNQLKYFLLNGYQEYNHMVMTGGASPVNTGLKSQLQLFLTRQGEYLKTQGELLNNVVSKLDDYENASEKKEKIEKLRHIKRLEKEGTLETLEEITKKINESGDTDNAGIVITKFENLVYYAPLDDPNFKKLKEIGNSNITEKGQKLGKLIQFKNSRGDKFAKFNLGNTLNNLYFSELPNDDNKLIYADKDKNIELLRL